MAPTRQNIFLALCQAALNGAELVIGSRMAGSDSQMPVTDGSAISFLQTF